MALYYPGELIADRYRVEQPLGSGGFGDVFEATDITSGRRVAVKVLKPDDGPGYLPSTRARFEREAQAVRLLRNPHTVRFEDFGESDGKLFITFELVRGDTLRSILDRHGTIAPAPAVQILSQLMESLAEAHRAGILHRDVKPENIHVLSDPSGRPTIKLLDFGLARPTDDGSPGVTKTGELLGTPRYMSPEQLLGKPLTAASDIYSAGIVLLEMLVGSDRLQGNQLGAQLDRLRFDHVFEVPELAVVAPGLAELVEGMTATSTAARYKSAGAVLRALQPQQEGQHATLHFERAPSNTRWVVLALLLVCVIGAGIALFGRPHESAEVAPEGSRTMPVALTEPQPTPVAAIVEPETELDLGSEPAPATWDRPNPAPSPGCGNVRPILDDLRVFVSDTNDALKPIPVLIVLPRDVSEVEFQLDTILRDSAQRRGRLLDTREEFLRSTRLLELASDLGLLVLIPGAGRGWDGDTDAAYIHDEFERLGENRCIDLRRVFLLADYDGGYSGLRLACEDWVTGIVTYSHLSYRSHGEQMCDTPKPALLLTPADSARVPVHGATECAPYSQPTLNKYEAVWRRRNNCRGTAVEAEVESGSCFEWTCDTPFRSCHISGGYNWPGALTRIRKGLHACGDEPPHRFDIEGQLRGFIIDTPPLPERAR